MLTSDQVLHYHENGYTVPDYRLSDEVLADIRSDHDRLILRNPQFRNYCPSLLAHDLCFLNYARIPKILDMVEQILGSDFALWNSSFFAKPACDGQATPWHQDGEYWPLRPLATCTVWMAIDNATIDNGCLRLIPGSHKQQMLREHQINPSPDLTLNQELIATEFSKDEAVDLTLEAGQISLHDIYMVHGSEENKSPNPRRGMTLRYMPTTSVFDRDLAARQAKEKKLLNHAQRTLFLMRGTDVSGRNDFRIRQ